jgi:hypothetical protein
MGVVQNVQAVQPLRSVQVVVKASTNFAYLEVIEGDRSYALHEAAEAYGLNLTAENQTARPQMGPTPLIKQGSGWYSGSEKHTSLFPL